MADKEVIDAIIEKFEKADCREKFNGNLNAWPPCLEMGHKIDDSYSVALEICTRCVGRFSTLLGIKNIKENWNTNYCLDIKAGGLAFREALISDDDNKWVIFRKAYLKKLKAKRAKM